MRNQADVVFNDNEVNFLPRIIFSIGVIGDFPEIPAGEMVNNLLKRNMPVVFKPLIFRRVPLVFQFDSSFKFPTASVHHLYVRVKAWF